MKTQTKTILALLVTMAVTPAAAQTPAAPPTPAPAPPSAPAAPATPGTPTSPAGEPMLAAVETLSPTATTGDHSTIVERVLVRVNGEILTQSQLTQRQVSALRDMDKDKRSDANLQETLAQITPDLLVTAVDELLLVQRAREMGVTFTDDQFKDSLDRIKKQNSLDDAGLKAALAQEGMTMDELRQQLEKQALIMAVQQREIGPSMQITQEEERQYYQKHQDKYMTPLTVMLREILIPVATTSQGGQNLFRVSDDNTAKATAESLRARAVAGEDFAKLAAEASASATKSNGGLVGPVNFEDLTPELKDTLKSLQPGGITPVMRGARGYQIFKLESRSTPELKPFDSVKSDIERDIRDERLDPETEKMLVRLRQQAVIEWKDDGFKKMYEKRIAERAANPDFQLPAGQ